MTLIKCVIAPPLCLLILTQVVVLHIFRLF